MPCSSSCSRGFAPRTCNFARDLADALLEKFPDRASGGFWFTAEGEDPPLHRPKSFADDAMPSGNGVAAQALARLGWLTGETRYLDSAEAAVRGGFPSLARSPQAHAAMLAALEEFLDPVEIVVIRGAPDEAAAWSASLAQSHVPQRMVLAIPSDTNDLPEALAGKRARNGTVAYVLSRAAVLGASDRASQPCQKAMTFPRERFSPFAPSGS